MLTVSLQNSICIYWLNCPAYVSSFNCRPFVYDISDPFSCVEIIICCISIPLRFISHDRINIKPVFVQIMAWRRTDDSLGEVTHWMYQDGNRKPADQGLFITNKLHSIRLHDDVIKWKKNPRYWPFVRGIHRSAGNSPHKGQWRGALMFSLICAWINGWVNNREAGDLRSHHAHYDVTVMV